MSAITAASDDEMQAKIERLRAENESLKQQLAQRVSDLLMELDTSECSECCGKGWNWEDHQVAERKSDTQTFKVECPACYGIGFVGPDAERRAAILSAAPAQQEQPAPPAGTPAPWPWPLETDKPAAQDEPVAWVHEDDDGRVISNRQKQQALRDGGASATSVRGFSIPACLTRAKPVQSSVSTTSRTKP